MPIHGIQFVISTLLVVLVHAQGATTQNPLVVEQTTQLVGLLVVVIVGQLVMWTVLIWLMFSESRAGKRIERLRPLIWQLRSGIDESRSRYWGGLHEEQALVQRNQEYEVLKQENRARIQEIIDGMKAEIAEMRKEGKAGATAAQRPPYYELEYAELKGRADEERERTLRAMNETMDGMRQIRAKEKEQVQNLERRRAQIQRESEAHRQTPLKSLLTRRPPPPDEEVANLTSSTTAGQPKEEEVKREANEGPFDFPHPTASDENRKSSTQRKKRQAESAGSSGLNIKVDREFRR